VAAVRALAAGGYRPVVTTSGRHSLAAASRWCSGSTRTPAVGSPAYPEAVREAARRLGALTVLAASDDALLALGAPVAHLVDKGALGARASSAGLVTPRSVEYDDAIRFRADLVAGRVALPVVVKPVVSSRPARLVASPADAEELDDVGGRFLVQPYLQGAMWALAGVMRGGRALAAVQQRYVRIWPVTCGTACAAVTITVDEDRVRALERLLEGYEGIFQAQFSGEALLDVNPRVYGSLPLAVAAGANLAAIWCASLDGEATPSPLRGRAGVRYRWLEGDVRHVVSRLRAGHMGIGAAAAALGPRTGTAHSVEALSDPGPLVARVRYAVGGRG
jgi:predicted ATP-grasp superfamily ATP-dependent carboligase